MIKTIIFDLGKVLFDFQDGLDELAKRLNTTTEELFPIFLQNDPDICAGKISPQELLERYEETFNKKTNIANFSVFWTGFLIPNRESIKLLTDLYNQGYSVGILTNIYPDTLDILKEEKKLPDIEYTTIVQSCEIGMVKPNTNIFEHTQSQLQDDPNEILFIDDSLPNCDTAIKIGWNIYHFSSTEDPEIHIKKILDIIDANTELTTKIQK
jgi:putative hydrolase of the HAD superfamily